MTAGLQKRIDTGVGQETVRVAPATLNTERIVLGKQPDASSRPHSAVEAAPHEPVPAAAPAQPASRLRRWWVWVPVAAAAAAGLWIGYQQLRAHRAAAGEAAGGSAQQTGKATLGFAEPAAAPESSQKTNWETAPVAVESGHSTLCVTGTLQAYTKSELVSNASGIVATVKVDRGDIVKQGDVLVQLDPVDARNRLAEGEALVAELKARLNLDEIPEPFDAERQPEVALAKAARDFVTNNFETRVRRLHDQKIVSDETYEQAATELVSTQLRYRQALQQIRQLYQSYQTALARLAILRKCVDDTTIKAPFDAMVVQRNVEVGEQVNAGMQATKVVTLVQINRLKLALTVPQQSIGAVQPQQKVHFEVDSCPGRTFAGAVKFITPVVTDDTRTLIVEAIVDNTEGLLRPGLFATAKLELPEEKTRYYVPESAVQRLEEAARVFVVRDGAAHEQVVSLGPTDGQRVEVTSGLKRGERVVLRPGKLKDGERVGVKDEG